MTLKLPKLRPAQLKKIFEKTKINKQRFEVLANSLGKYLKPKKVDKYCMGDREPIGNGLVLDLEYSEVLRKETFEEFLSEINRKAIVKMILGRNTQENDILFIHYLKSILAYVYNSFIIAIYLFNTKTSQKNDIYNIIKTAYRFCLMLDIPYKASRVMPSLDMNKFNDFIKYLTIFKVEANTEGYLDITLIVKILAEVESLPLKGKSLEEYKKAIINSCEKLIKENELKTQNEI